VAGCKSEDTILIAGEQNVVLTAVDGWPEIPVEVDGQSTKRPAILEVT
jgi:hypothetical protein